jgi:hypothetical protein
VWRRVAASSLEGGSLATPASSRSYEGAPNQEMAADCRVSPWRGGNDDDGGRKHAGTVRGSIAGVDEMRARLAVGGGERESLAVR